MPEATAHSSGPSAAPHPSGLPAAPHLLAARHLVLGTTNLLVLSLPPGWHIREGIGAPEVDARTIYAGRAWGTIGRAHYVLWGEAPDAQHAPPRLELDLRLQHADSRSGPPEPPIFTRIETEGETELGGHSARYLLGDIRHGLFGRERRTALWVCAHCDETERWLALTVRAPLRRAGAADPGHLAAMLARLPEALCH